MGLFNLVIAASAFLLAAGTVNIFLLWALHSLWWKLKTVRFFAFLIPVMAVASTVLWAFGHLRGWSSITAVAAVTTPGLFIVQLSLLVSLPFSGIVHLAVNTVGHFKQREPAFSGGRRKFIKLAAVAFPATAVSSGLTGVAESYAPIKVPVKQLPITDLPASLQGFRIAHLSDLHLGYYVHLDHLESVVKKIKLQQPDLALVTGDISDDLKILPQAIEIINILSPKYGIYACVGNHEYYRGIVEVLKIFANAPFPMLIDQHINMEVRGTRITLGGADDPRTLRRDYGGFLENTIENTMSGAQPDSFKLLMCHRPEGFNYSALKGIDLVLSGHTHGGQLGFGGRSLLEPIFPEKYLWGVYRRGKTTLYTSGGMGHWIPFRLGVPAEAPILVLGK